MHWRKWQNWQKIASRWRFELDAKSGPLEAGEKNMLRGTPGSQVKKKIQQSLDINVQRVCDERLDK